MKEIFNECMKVYYDWHINSSLDGLGFKPKIDKSDGRGLKEIITYLNSLNCDVVSTFQYIFLNWDTLPNYIKSNTRLRQINSNIHNIIYHFKKKNNVTGVSEDYIRDIASKLSE